MACGGARDCRAVGWKLDSSLSDDTPVAGSADGGATWTSRASLHSGIKLVAASCAAAGTCVLVGSSDRPAGVALTTVGGNVDWTSNAIGPDSGDFRGITCAGLSWCMAVGEDGAVLSSKNGGASWTSHAPGTTKMLEAVTCRSTVACIAVGDEGTILASVDGGTTWTSRTSGTSDDLYAVTCPSSSLCLAGGDQQHLGERGRRRLVERPQERPPMSIAPCTALPVPRAAAAWPWATVVPFWPAPTEAPRGRAVPRAPTTTCIAWLARAAAFAWPLA